MLDSTELAEGDRVLHVGCGTGYYTAILAETVGPSGRVTALEIDERLAERARRNLEDRPNVTVLRADGCGYDPGPVDGIVVSAGASHPPGIWLDALRPGGRMVLPLTVEAAIHGWGFVLRVKREKEGYAARFVCPVGIFPCAGARDPEMNRRLHAALSERGSLALAVRSLRRRAHEPAETCWLHGEGFCLSTLPLDGAGVEPPTG
jgi:protein-L-isoaspartate(D-aspartate) O-methyltransferase